jgi:hypothetical protein
MSKRRPALILEAVLPDQPNRTVSPVYAIGQLQRAMARAAESGDAADRERALEKARRWQDVLAGMADGRIQVGRRTPVADTPAWVTLEVAHGGFATGRYLAEAPLTGEEAARLAALPAGVPGEPGRERLNLWYLGDDGQAELLDALRSGRYRVEVPEEAALAVVVLLLAKGFPEQALDLVAELRPLMYRLRFAPRFESVARPSGAAVRLVPVSEAVRSLRAVRTPPQLAAMRQTLRVWNPLYDRLVDLWCQTVDGELPYLDEVGAVHGGWPCRQWPADWADGRSHWLADYEQAGRDHPLAGRHAHVKSNFSRLRGALLASADGSDGLSARDVGWIRRALANTLTRHGAPGSGQRDAVRAVQGDIATAPDNAALAELLARRLELYPADGGLSSLEPIAVAVSGRDSPIGDLPCGTPIPAHLLGKAARALEAPADELVRRGVITSADTLAAVLPQLTSRLMAAGIDDPVLAGLYEQAYTAFRRRRGLLLLNLEHQVRFEELPWVTALAPCRSPRPGNGVPARRALEQATMLALTAFPHALLPNPLIRELGPLARQASVPLPLVEEMAADIFMGTFTTKWRDAAAVASRIMAGTVYGDYYDLPPESRWTVRPRSIVQWGRETAADFADACTERAAEAGNSGNYVARNGAVLEQAQILTTHNLAALVDGLGLSDQLREQAPALARQTFGWVVRRLAQRTGDRHAALIQVKNAAYAWRQAIFLLSFCEASAQMSLLHRLEGEIHNTGSGPQFSPAIDGLAHVISGGRFSAAGTVPGSSGRRFLGWALGPHCPSSWQ